MTSAEKLAGGIDAFVDFVGRATSWLALGLALVMGANVLMRYAFSYGFIWAQELEWHIFHSDLPVRHVLRAAPWRACAGRRAVSVFHAAQQASR